MAACTTPSRMPPSAMKSLRLNPRRVRERQGHSSPRSGAERSAGRRAGATESGFLDMRAAGGVLGDGRAGLTVND